MRSFASPLLVLATCLFAWGGCAGDGGESSPEIDVQPYGGDIGATLWETGSQGTVHGDVADAGDPSSVGSWALPDSDSSAAPHLDNRGGSFSLTVGEVFLYSFHVIADETATNLRVGATGVPTSAVVELDPSSRDGSILWEPSQNEVGNHVIELSLFDEGEQALDSVLILIQVLPSHDLVEFGF